MHKLAFQRLFVSGVFHTQIVRGSILLPVVVLRWAIAVEEFKSIHKTKAQKWYSQMCLSNAACVCEKSNTELKLSQEVTI